LSPGSRIQDHHGSFGAHGMTFLRQRMQIPVVNFKKGNFVQFTDKNSYSLFLLYDREEKIKTYRRNI
jgi:hypothetical protein